MTPARSLLDTSVWIALEGGRQTNSAVLTGLAPHALSVITQGELWAGVLAAQDPDVRSLRLGTVSGLAGIEVLPVDGAVAREWARLRAHLAEVGRTVGVNDLWIAATAAAYRLPVITQDQGFQALRAARGVDIVLV